MIALQLPFVRKASKQQSFLFKEESFRLARIYLLTAGIIYLTNGFVYYSQGLIHFSVMLMDVTGGLMMLGSVLASYHWAWVKKHLQALLVVALYLVMVQSVFESIQYKYDLSHAIMHLIVYMVCSMPFKKFNSLAWFLVVNFLLIAGSTFFVEGLLIEQAILILVFFVGGLVSLISIGARLKAQEKLKRNEEFFKNMFNESAGANFLADMDTMKTVSCNKKAVEMFEAFGEEQIVGIDPQLFQVSSFNATEINAIREEIKDKWGWSREVAFKTLKGKKFWGNLEYRAVRFQNKEFLQVRVTDVSDRKRLEKLLWAEKQVLEIASKEEGLEKPFTTLLQNVEDLCESMRCAIMLSNPQGTEIRLGFSASIDRSFVNQVEQFTLRFGTGLNYTAAATKRPVEIAHLDSVQMRNENPGALFIDGLNACASFPIVSDNGNVRGCLAVYHYCNKEITGQEQEIIARVMNICRVLLEKDAVTQANREFVQTLQLKNEELRKTNDELDRFVYSTSHDLRVPLTNMLGLIDITKMTVTDETPVKYLDMMKQSVVSLDDVIRGILDYSRNSRSEVTVEEVSIKEIVQKTQDMLKYHNGFDHVAFRMRADEGIPLYTDKARLTTVISNLLSNSIKYYNKKEQTPYISVTAKVTEEKVLIFVEDNGIGIPEEYQQKIFDMFYRASSQATGSGLGLYILKETLQKLDGKISVISGKDVGSTFVVEIPNHPPAQTLRLSA
ncbi:MAG TPA: GAF domain-containing sensor histidine kinase [Chitinophagales bacterium]|nr:GAF domain-containing sensor histidine kinase [Chitinophagales bacterium]